jgi:phosphoglycolate/pyridoxal phosphate phosphatase family enzyme
MHAAPPRLPAAAWCHTCGVRRSGRGRGRSVVMAHQQGNTSASTGGWRSVRVADFDAFLLDMDGVLWHGAAPVPGSLETVAALQAAGKRCFFVTNNATRSRAAVAARLTHAGIAASAETVLTSGSAAAEFLTALVRPSGASTRTAFVIGEAGLVTELSLAGIVCDCGPPGEVSLSDADFGALFAPSAPTYDAVVVSYDGACTSAKLARASAAVQRGAALVGTNPDAGDRCGGGLQPGAGVFIAALEAATGTRAIVVGKPAPTLIAQLLARHGLDPRRTVMIGDRLDTDIAFGTAGGVETCLVLTGVATLEQAELLAADDARRPTHLMSSLAGVQW